MANLTITIPDAKVVALLDDFAAATGYNPANGLTKAQHAKAMIAAYVRDVVTNYRLTHFNDPTHAAALAAAVADIDVS